MMPAFALLAAVLAISTVPSLWAGPASGIEGGYSIAGTAAFAAAVEEGHSVRAANHAANTASNHAAIGGGPDASTAATAGSNAAKAWAVAARSYTVARAAVATSGSEAETVAATGTSGSEAESDSSAKPTVLPADPAATAAATAALDGGSPRFRAQEYKHSTSDNLLQGLDVR